MAINAWIGLGQMGRPMAVNLLPAGHEVRGVEISPQAKTAYRLFEEHAGERSLARLQLVDYENP